ncbi:eCIS core domain-containing protein [Kitasatospora acidiphila]
MHAHKRDDGRAQDVAPVRNETRSHEHEHGAGCAHHPVSPQQAMALQRSVGNAATSRMITAQRSAVHDVLRTSGAPLAQPVRQDMEEKLGADFSDVRLHTDTAAQRSAVELGAHAYTSGNHIVSGPGTLDRETLAHELFHVVQQRRGPVAGTDTGGGLRVSDPGDRHEREAEAVAKRVVSGNAPSLGHAEASPSGAATGHVQRLVGFEAEIDLPVTKGNGQMFEVGDTKLGDSTMPLAEGEQAPAFDVVTDKRSLNNTTSYSNMEFVTGAVSVVGPDHETGAQRLHRIADEIRVVQQQFYAKAAHNPRSKLSGGSLNLTLTDKGNTAKLASHLAYRDTRQEDGDGGLFVHYSVGVPITGMPVFFDALRAADPHDRERDPYNSNKEAAPGDQFRQARFRLFQAKEFGRNAVLEFRKWAGTGKRKRGNDAQDEAALDGYSQLVYTQLTGMADYQNGQPKNSLIALSRSNLGTVRARLPESVQDFLDTFDVNAEDNVFAELFDDMQKQTFSGKDGEGYNPEDTRQIDEASREVSFENYANSAFKRAGSGLAEGDVTQEEVFGGMNTIEPHDEHGSVMVPMEIRRLGGGRKTWDQLKQDLANLVNWAEKAYQKDQDLTQSESDQEDRPLPSRPRT